MSSFKYLSLAELEKTLQKGSSTTCPGYAQTADRSCRRPIGRERRLRIASALGSVRHELTPARLQEVAKMCLCTQNHSSQASKLAAQWLDEISTLPAKESKIVAKALTQNALPSRAEKARLERRLQIADFQVSHIGKKLLDCRNRIAAQDADRTLLEAQLGDTKLAKADLETSLQSEQERTATVSLRLESTLLDLKEEQSQHRACRQALAISCATNAKLREKNELLEQQNLERSTAFADFRRQIDTMEVFACYDDHEDAGEGGIVEGC